MDKDRLERKEKLMALLKDKRYRDAFVSEYIDAGISFQIRALRKREGWTQKKLSELTGMKQERISVTENPNYSRFNIKTLKRIASAFEVAFIGRFVPISELVDWEINLSSEKLAPVSFEKDPYFKPEAINVSCQVGLSIGGSMSLESPEVQIESKKTEKMGNLYLVGGRQKKTDENKMESQEEPDMPLHNSLFGGIKQNEIALG